MAYQVLGDFSAYIEARRRGEPPLPAHLGWRPRVHEGAPMPAPDDYISPVAAKVAGHAGAEAPEGSDDSTRPRVGESTDPVIHQLLAQRQGAMLNGDEDMVRGIDAHLAELGYHRTPPSEEETDA